MANNYTEFSFSIPLETLEEREWVEKLLADPPKELRPDWCEPEDDCLDLEFDWEIEDNGDQHEMFIYSQDGRSGQSSATAATSPGRTSSVARLLSSGLPTAARSRASGHPPASGSRGS
jgi:hypothetical protein